MAADTLIDPAAKGIATQALTTAAVRNDDVGNGRKVNPSDSDSLALENMVRGNAAAAKLAVAELKLHPGDYHSQYGGNKDVGDDPQQAIKLISDALAKQGAAVANPADAALKPGTKAPTQRLGH